MLDTYNDEVNDINWIETKMELTNTNICISVINASIAKRDMKYEMTP